MEKRVPNYTVWRDGELVGANFYTIANAKAYARNMLFGPKPEEHEAEVKDNENKTLFRGRWNGDRMKWNAV